LKRKLLIPAGRPLTDFLPTLTIKAKDFATEVTSHNVIEKNLSGTNQISDEHVENKKAVRNMMIERGVNPEALSDSEDVKKCSVNWTATLKKCSTT
jgi:DNA-damage-inducible protein D